MLPVLRCTVRQDQSVFHPDDAVGTCAHFVLVRDEQNRAAFSVQVVEEVQDVLGAFAVQVPGRFVRQQHGGVLHERAGNGDALLLPPGEFVGFVVQPFAQPHALQGASRQPLAFTHGRATVRQGEFHVLQGAGAGQQVERLEHEPDPFVPNTGQAVF